MRRRLALAAVGLLVVLSGCRKAPEPAPPLVPGFAQALPSLEQLHVQQGRTVLAFARKGGPWRITTGAWRADRRWLQPLLLGLAEARCDEARTADPSRFERIGVAWPPASEVTSDDAAFARPTGRLAMRIDGRDVALVIGHAHPRGGTYVRVEGMAHACLTRVDLRLPAQPSQWFDPQLWQVPIEAITTIRVEDRDAPPVTLVRGESGFRAEGQLLALSPLPDALAAALAAPRQSDLRATLAVEAPERVVHLDAPEGRRYALALRSEDGRTWATVIDAPESERGDFEGRDFLLPREVADPLWAPRRELGGQ